MRTLTYCGEVLWTTVLASVFAVKQHLLYVMTSPLHKLQHVEGLAGEKLGVAVCGLPYSGHEIIKVSLFHTQESSHPEDVIPPELGLSKGVVVAEGYGWEIHDGTVHFIQNCNMGVLIILDHTVGHLEQEDGKRGAECSSPEQPPESHSTGQKYVAQAVERTVGPENSDV